MRGVRSPRGSFVTSYGGSVGVSICVVRDSEGNWAALVNEAIGVTPSAGLESGNSYFQSDAKTYWDLEGISDDYAVSAGGIVVLGFDVDVGVSPYTGQGVHTSTASLGGGVAGIGIPVTVSKQKTAVRCTNSKSFMDVMGCNPFTDP